MSARKSDYADYAMILLLGTCACSGPASQPSAAHGPVSSAPRGAAAPAKMNGAPADRGHGAPSPAELGAQATLNWDCHPDDIPEPAVKCTSAGLFSTRDRWGGENPDLWNSDNAVQGKFDWLPPERVLKLPEDRLPAAVALLETAAFIPLATDHADGPRPYLLRAVYPALPGPPGCRHIYGVRLDPAGVVTVVNPTLSRMGQCPVPMKRAAVVAYLDRPPAAAFASATTLSQ